MSTRPSWIKPLVPVIGALLGLLFSHCTSPLAGPTIVGNCARNEEVRRVIRHRYFFFHPAEMIAIYYKDALEKAMTDWRQAHSGFLAAHQIGRFLCEETVAQVSLLKNGREEALADALAAINSKFYSDWLTSLAIALQPEHPFREDPKFYVAWVESDLAELVELRKIIESDPAHYNSQDLQRFDRILEVRRAELVYLKNVLARLASSPDVGQTSSAMKKEGHAMDSLPPDGVPNSPRDPGGE